MIQKLISIFILLFLNTSWAQKNAVNGDTINSDVFNSSTLSIGSIQQSILTPLQFQTINGDCWRLMDGSPLTGTDLGTLTGMTNIPDMLSEGTFLRQAKAGRSLGSYEADDNKAHKHEGVNTHPTHNEPFGKGSYRNGTRYAGANEGAMPATYTSTIGGVEARPKNIAVNFFIKVNKQCNFN